MASSLPVRLVVSGLPASGKTALGRRVADRLGFAFLDKDDILERLFESHPQIDTVVRQKLSRESDQLFIEQARALDRAVLVSFWRPPDRSVNYGTPTAWLNSSDLLVIELHCQCEPAVAYERFTNRERHPGHNDDQRLDGLSKQMEDLAAIGPLGLWPLVEIETSDLRALDDLTSTAVSSIDELLA